MRSKLLLILYFFKSLIFLLATIIIFIIFWLNYRFKVWRARKRACKELVKSGLSAELAEQLSEIIVPDIGGMKEWISLAKSKNY